MINLTHFLIFLLAIERHGSDPYVISNLLSSGTLSFHRSSIGPYILYMNEWFDQIPYRIVSGYTQEKIHMNRNEAFPHIIPFI